MRHSDSLPCYVYVLLDPRKPGEYRCSYWTFDFEPFYVGKGCGNRIKSTVKYDKHIGKSGTFKAKVLAKIRREGYDEIPCKIIRNDLSDTEAFALERKMICKIGRRNLDQGPLVNLSDGGEGEIGAIRTRKTRKLLSELARQQNASMTQEKREAKSQKLRSAATKRKASEESIRTSKISAHWANLSEKEKAKIKAKKLATRIANGWVPRESKRKLTPEEYSEVRRQASLKVHRNRTKEQKRELGRKITQVKTGMTYAIRA